jgi:hypothetical protein
MTQRKRNERSALVKQSDPAQLDDAGCERPGPHADVIFTLEVGVKRWWQPWLKVFTKAPATSPLGQTLAAVPLCAILTLPAFAMAAIGFFFVKIPLLTAGLTVVGFAGGAWFAWSLTRLSRPGPVVNPPVIKGRVVAPVTRPVPIALPEPDTEAGTASP